MWTKVKKEIDLSLENIFDILRVYGRQPLPDTTRTRIYRRVLSKANETAIQLMLPGFEERRASPLSSPSPQDSGRRVLSATQPKGFETLPQMVFSDSESLGASLFSRQSNACFDSDAPTEEPVFIPEQQLELPFPILRQPNYRAGT